MLEKLRDKRINRHYSLQTMANKLGISKSYYWQIEQGERRILYQLAIKIATIFKCTTDELFADYYSQKLNLKGVESYVSEIENN